MNLLFVPPEGIQVEKRLWTKRTVQLHIQLGPAHMGADGCMKGGESFVAPLNPAIFDPLGGPHVNMKGCHVRRDGKLQSLRNGQRRGLMHLYAPLATEVKDSRSALSGSWEGGFDIVAVGVHGCLLIGCGAISIAEQDWAPHESPYRPSASDPATADSSFWRPSASKQ